MSSIVTMSFLLSCASIPVSTYTTDLYGFVSSPDPILSLHASIGQRLLSLDTLTPTVRVKSRNARG
jgi:hypothetical protein